MTTKYFLDEKKITKKALTEKIGADRVKRMTQEAREGFFEDPLTEQSFWIGSGCLTIEFK